MKSKDVKQTFIVDGKRLIFIEQVVAANIAVFSRTVSIVGFDLDDLVSWTSFVHIDHVRRLVEFRGVFVDVIDADVHRGAALSRTKDKMSISLTRSGQQIKI